MPVRSLNSSILKWPNREKVEEELKKWIEEITQKRKDIIRIGYFGSYARGDMTEDSDLDFLVEMEPDRNLLDRVSLLLDLEKLLGCKVDVVSDKGIKTRIRERVLREAQPL